MKTKLIRALVIAAVATSATLPARAEWFGWQGKSGQTSYFDDKDCWGGNKGSKSVGSAYNHWFGYGDVTVLNPTVTSQKSQSLSGKMIVMTGTYTFVAEDASDGINSSTDIEIGSATATAEFKSGTYKFKQTKIGTEFGQTGTLKVSGGTFTSSTYLCVGSGGTGDFQISGGTVSNGSNDMPIGDSSAGTVTVTSGKYVNSHNSGGYGIRVGCAGTGTLNVESGEVELTGGAIGLCTSSDKIVSGTVNITGGTVTTSQIKYGDGSGTGTLTIDGGTVRAYANNVDFIPAHNNLNVYVGANGATIDANGNAITIGSVLANKSDEAGKVTFKGGGTVTLSGTPTYTGTTTVEVGTTVHVPTPGSIGAGLAVSVPATTPADGTYKLLVCDGEGTFTDDLLTGVEAPANSRLLVTSGGKSVVCIYGSDPGPVWIGGTSGSLSDASNWANNAVPGAGTNCVIGVASAATLTVGDTFAPASITFPADSAVVTIEGDVAIAGIAAITNLSTTANHVFNVALSGADNAAVVMNTQTYCVFNGGMTAYDVDFSQSPASDDARTFAGNWTLTTTADWTPAKNATVASGASLTVKNYSNNASDTLLINAGGVVTAEVAKVTGSSDGYLTRGINGTMVVTGECKMDSTGVNRFVAQETSTGTIIANKFSSTSTSIKYLLKNDNGFRHVVGAGGIAGTGWRGYSNWNSVIACTNDFEITGTIEGYASGTMNTYTLDTTGGYRVALASGGKLTGARMALNVIGDGTFALAGGTADFQKELTVGSNATLEVAQSGTATLGGALTLSDGATLGFNFTGNTVSPVLDLTGKTVTANGTVNVKVSAARGIRPKSGRYALTFGGNFSEVVVSLDGTGTPTWVEGLSVDNGDIVLDVKPQGLIVYNFPN